jgi:hypothetical protein
MLLIARAAARCGSCGIPGLNVGSALDHVPCQSCEDTSTDSLWSLLNSWSRPAPSVRRQHRSTEEDRQHQERQTGCRLLPKRAIDPFDSLGQGKGRDSVRLDHRDEGPSHENRRAEMRIKKPAGGFGNTAEWQSRRWLRSPTLLEGPKRRTQRNHRHKGNKRANYGHHDHVEIALAMR